MIGIKIEIFDKVVWLTNDKEEFKNFSKNAKEEVLCYFNGNDSIDDAIAYGEFNCSYFFEFTDKDGAIAYINNTPCFELDSKSIMHLSICLGAIICKQMKISTETNANVLAKIANYLYDRILAFRNRKEVKDSIEFDFATI